MRIISTAVILAVSFISAISPAFAQDFDCKAAKGATEKAICSSDQLRALDEQMGVTYGYARRAKLSEKAEKRVMREQKAWIKERNRCGADTSCLERAYRARIKVLEDEADSSASGSGSRCLIYAYSIDKDRNGLNVRSGPGKKHSVMTRLKPIDDGGYLIYPEFEIVGSEGNWLRITNARAGLGGDVIFDGEGYVHRNLVATMTRGYDNGYVTMRKARSASSQRVGKVPRETQVKVKACNGDWALVAFKGKSGWLAPDDMCGTPATTCN